LIFLVSRRPGELHADVKITGMTAAAPPVWLAREAGQAIASRLSEEKHARWRLIIFPVVQVCHPF